MISENMDQVKQREEYRFSGLNVKELKDIFHRDADPGPAMPGPYKPTCVFLLLYNLAEPHILAIQKTDTEGYPWRNQVALPGGAPGKRRRQSARGGISRAGGRDENQPRSG